MAGACKMVMIIVMSVVYGLILMMGLLIILALRGICKVTAVACKMMMIIVMNVVYELILMMGWLIILALRGIYKVILIISGLQDVDSGDGFALKDDSDDLLAQGTGIVGEDESSGTRPTSIAEKEAKEAETLSVLLHRNKAKRIKHYSSTQKILLVGEGNFSFSACLAKSYGSATNMVATSLDSYDFIVKHYKSGGLLNLSSLKERGCRVIHEVDATTMANRADIGSMVFDIIVYNFPHSGFRKKSESQVNELKRHRYLIRRFFENAKTMLSIGGEVHVTHKTNGVFKEWNIEELAEQCGLHVIEKTAFNLRHYPGYETKYGFGGNKNFDCYPSMTYKFGLFST